MNEVFLEPGSSFVTSQRRNLFEIVLQIVLHWLLLNHIIIAGKLVIYNSRLKNILPSLRYLMIKLDHIESIERSIAIKNNRLKTHEGKWKPLIN